MGVPDRVALSTIVQPLISDSNLCFKTSQKGKKSEAHSEWRSLLNAALVGKLTINRTLSLTLLTTEVMSHLQCDGSFLGHGLIDTIKFHIVVEIIHWALQCTWEIKKESLASVLSCHTTHTEKGIPYWAINQKKFSPEQSWKVSENLVLCPLKLKSLYIKESRKVVLKSVTLFQFLVTPPRL